MHYWKLWPAWGKLLALTLALPIHFALINAEGCCGNNWCNGNGNGGCCNGNQPFGPFGNGSGACPPGIFTGGFVNGNNGPLDGGFSNNRQSGGDYVGQDQGRGPNQRPQYPSFPQGGGGFPQPQPLRPNPQFPPFSDAHQDDNGGIGPRGRSGPPGPSSFVGPPPPYPQQPMGPLRPQIDNGYNNNNNFGNRFDNNNNNGYDNRRSSNNNNNYDFGPLLPDRPVTSSTGNTNTGVTFAGRQDDPDMADLKHPFEGHRRLRRRRRQLSSLFLWR